MIMLRWLTAAAVSLAAMLSASPAWASFPGQNGKIAFEQSTSGGGRDIWTTPPLYWEATNLTNSPGDRDLDPAWDATGRLIAFASNRDGDFDIYIMRQDGTLDRKLTNGGGAELHPAWSPDGARIAFESPNPDGTNGIWVATVNGSEPIKPILPFGGGQPAWSPDGTRIAYTSNPVPPETRGSLHLIDPDGSNDVQVTGLAVEDPDWSPDGSEIAFTTRHTTDPCIYYDAAEIYAIKPDGSGLRNISNHCNIDTNNDLQAAWAPDGTKVAGLREVVDPRGNFYSYISIMDAAGSGDEQAIVSGYGFPSFGDPSWQQLGHGYVASTNPYPRPASATPTRVPLVPAYRQCSAPNEVHADPQELFACNPPTQESTLLTTSSVGRGRGFVTLKATLGDSSTSADEADIALSARVTDVLCKTAQGSLSCPGPGAEYTGRLLLRLRFRVTDHGNPSADIPATLMDFPLYGSLECEPTPGLAGGNCSLNTTLFAVWPGFPKEGAQTVFSLLSVEVLDPGGDGYIDLGCPPYPCGSGDENTFLTQGLFTP